MNPNLPPNQNTYADDEIDLIELWQTIWSQKLLITFITALITISTGTIAFNLPKTFEAETLLVPPRPQNIEQLNLNTQQLNTQQLNTQQLNTRNHSLTIEDVFKSFQNDLLSIQNQRRFFEQHNLTHYFADKVTPNKSEFELFRENFKFTPAAKNANTGTASFKYQFDNPSLSAQWLNDYVSFTLEKTKNELINDVNSKVFKQITELSQELEARVIQAKNDRQQQILVLTEALEIAEKVNISAPAINQQTLQDYPEYLKGTRLLSAEIDALKRRKSDEPFIPRLSDIRLQLDILNNIKINPELIQVAKVDQIAKIPVHPIKPKKSLIVAVAFVLGGMLGVFIALIRGAIRKRREQKALTNELK